MLQTVCQFVQLRYVETRQFVSCRIRDPEQFLDCLNPTDDRSFLSAFLSALFFTFLDRSIHHEDTTGGETLQKKILAVDAENVATPAIMAENGERHQEAL